MDSRLVYTWIATGAGTSGDAVLKPASRPAIRLWGDALLEMVAERGNLTTIPSIAIRRHALFAWRDSSLPDALAEMAVGRQRQAVMVDEERCATARLDVVGDLYSQAGWRVLLDWLVDRGYDAGVVEEELPPVVVPFAPMRVDDADEAVRWTRPKLIDDVLEFFGPVAEDYLAT